MYAVKTAGGGCHCHCNGNGHSHSHPHCHHQLLLPLPLPATTFSQFPHCTRNWHGHWHCRYGLDGVICSNHGGRQLDYARSGIEVLEEVVDALEAAGVRDKLEVLVDGGVRRGSVQTMLELPRSPFTFKNGKKRLRLKLILGLWSHNPCKRHA
jgi:hypothetical protein